MSTTPPLSDDELTEILSGLVGVAVEANASTAIAMLPDEASAERFEKLAVATYERNMASAYGRALKELCRVLGRPRPVGRCKREGCTVTLFFPVA